MSYQSMEEAKLRGEKREHSILESNPVRGWHRRGM